MTATIEPTVGDAARTRRPPWWLLVSLIALAVAVFLSVAFGARVVSLGEVWTALTTDSDDVTSAAVRSRVPRTILAIVVGAALAVAGAVLQAVTRNPLADPFILGINSGASLLVVIAIAFFGAATMPLYIVFALAGAALAAVFVYSVGSLGIGGPTPLKLALAGAITTAAFTSLSSAILLPRIDVMRVFRFWQVGSVGRAENHDTLMVLPILLVGAAVCLLAARSLNILALGDEAAAGLGVHVTRTRIGAAAGAIILCGGATALAGPIGFIGLIVPHLVRQLVGADHRWLLPVCAVAGATLLTLADVAGRVLGRPDEIDVGVVTALIGGPVFLWVVLRRPGARA
ncbi:FecCD family ABC transporter permease [Aeromicrobium duanguangcaii]|uniref:Iron ABC transporter permease n=1 Tax=Aeromicrobium duanguangcaii TaxID=2968086 RepID=A0ABY5KD27_9ACTN|nr:iron ABC transporter permease [Aeromicrobium duanguangcaii]MCD9155121.1 iron ABC transporter permease [Aeromicrobium duanguangcaii]UUI68225.1 iron ABC transporter permease [Aeromicrobium duanguangcaii]